jgi:hypothetical protein
VPSAAPVFSSPDPPGCTRFSATPPTARVPCGYTRWPSWRRGRLRSIYYADRSPGLLQPGNPPDLHFQSLAVGRRVFPPLANFRMRRIQCVCNLDTEIQCDLERERLRRDAMLDHEHEVGTVTWSPDSRSIAYLSWRSREGKLVKCTLRSRKIDSGHCPHQRRRPTWSSKERMRPTMEVETVTPCRRSSTASLSFVDSRPDADSVCPVGMVGEIRSSDHVWFFPRAKTQGFPAECDIWRPRGQPRLSFAE